MRVCKVIFILNHLQTNPDLNMLKEAEIFKNNKNLSILSYT